MIASLPMYWRPETAPAWMRFWRALQASATAQGIDLPEATLPHAMPSDWTQHWLSPDLALSQTCGLPFRTVLKSRVTYVGTLDFGLGGTPGHYHSVLIARPGPLPEAPRLAYNEALSQSGWGARLRPGDAPLPERYGGYLATGGHAASLRAVAEGRADLALLDAVTWRLLKRANPETEAVTVLGRTAPTPGLPLICALERDPAPLRAALCEALDSLDPTDMVTMGAQTRLDLVVLPEAAYYAVPIPEAPPGSAVA